MDMRRAWREANRSTVDSNAAKSKADVKPPRKTNVKTNEGKSSKPQEPESK
jgi:hypothetical protein